MCLILHMASKSPAPIVPWNEAAKGVWTSAPKDSDLTELRPKFCFEHIAHVGSSSHCGCNFRHANFQQGGWFDDYLVEQPDYDPAPEEADHRALVSFLKKHFTSDGELEFFGVWGGTWNTSIEGRLKLRLDQILDPKFHFREKVLYTVELNEKETVA